MPILDEVKNSEAKFFTLRSLASLQAKFNPEISNPVFGLDLVQTALASPSVAKAAATVSGPIKPAVLGPTHLVQTRALWKKT